MDNSKIPGFITRKHASEICTLSERTLQRHWSRAVELRDENVLTHLKMWTEDGEIIDGPDVTKKGIDELKRARKNPTWYVKAVWAEKTYGPRVSEKPPTETSVSDVQAATQPANDVTTILKEQIQSLEQDKRDLREELKIKNEQIRDANERGRETHVLMRDLHELLRDMQRRLPAPAADQVQGIENASPVEAPSDAVIVNDGGPKVPKPRASTKKKQRTSSRTRKKRPAKKQVGFWKRDVRDLLPFRKS